MHLKIIFLFFFFLPSETIDVLNLGFFLVRPVISGSGFVFKKRTLGNGVELMYLILKLEHFGDMKFSSRLGS